jgi:hypothetical protein
MILHSVSAVTGEPASFYGDVPWLVRAILVDTCGSGDEVSGTFESAHGCKNISKEEKRRGAGKLFYGGNWERGGSWERSSNWECSETTDQSTGIVMFIYLSYAVAHDVRDDSPHADAVIHSLQKTGFGKPLSTGDC